MAYTKTDWQPGDIITAQKMQKIENSIVEISTELDNINIVIPSSPSTDGKYILKCTVVNGQPTYSWGYIVE